MDSKNQLFLPRQGRKFITIGSYGANCAPLGVVMFLFRRITLAAKGKGVKIPPFHGWGGPGGLSGRVKKRLGRYRGPPLYSAGARVLGRVFGLFVTERAISMLSCFFFPGIGGIQADKLGYGRGTQYPRVSVKKRWRYNVRV